MKCKNCGFFTEDQPQCAGCGHAFSSSSESVAMVCKQVSDSLGKIIDLKDWPSSLANLYIKYYGTKYLLIPIIWCVAVGIIDRYLLFYFFVIFWYEGLIPILIFVLLIPVIILILAWIFSSLAEALGAGTEPYEGSLFYHENQLLPEWTTNLNLLYDINNRATNTDSETERNEYITLMEGLRITLTKQACALYLIRTEKLTSRLNEICHYPAPDSATYIGNKNAVHEIITELSNTKAEICQDYFVEKTDAYRKILDEESRMQEFCESRLEFLTNQEKERIKRETLNRLGKVKLLEARDKADAFIESRHDKQAEPVIRQQHLASDDLDWEAAEAKYKTIGDARVIRDTDSKEGN